MFSGMASWFWASDPDDKTSLVSDHLYYYYQYDTKLLVRTEPDETSIKLYSVTDEEYVETINFTDVLGVSVGEHEYHIHTCPRHQASLERVYRERILEPIDETINLSQVGTHPDWYDRLASEMVNRKLLVIINPAGGSKNAAIEYDANVRRLFTYAGCDCDAYTTKFSGDAKQYIKSTQLDRYQQLLVLGGDGTVSEVVNGLLERSDSDETINRIPVSVIPVGSGNGLARSIIHEAKEEFCLMTAIYRAIKGGSIRVPLIENRIGNRVYHSFLANGWGLPSDVDIESEFYRFIGSFRFTVGAIIRMINLRVYHGKIHYLPLGRVPDLKLYQKDGIRTNKWKTLTSDTGFVLMWACNAPYVAEDMLVAPTMQLGSERISLILVRYPISRWELFSMFLAIEKGGHIESPKVETYQALGLELDPVGGEKGCITIDGEQVEYGKLQSFVTDRRFKMI